MSERLGAISFKEMMEQDEAWQSVIDNCTAIKEIVDEVKAKDIERVIFTGCGSSYYISLSASFVFNNLTNVNSSAVPSSELIFFNDTYLQKSANNLIILVSRSGDTTEVVKALENVRGDNVISLGVTCNPDSVLASECDYSFVASKGKEESVVMTKSFTSLLLSLQHLAGYWSNNANYLAELKKLPKLFTDRVERWNNKISDFVKEAKIYQKYTFLGQGNYYGIANEAMLKMKEMAILQSEDFHSLEFRHGPKSIADQEMLVSINIGQQTLGKEFKLCQDLKELEAELIIIADQYDQQLDELASLNITLDTGLPQFTITPLSMVPHQLFAYHTAVKKGINVDSPQNLTQVVKEI